MVEAVAGEVGLPWTAQQQEMQLQSQRDAGLWPQQDSVTLPVSADMLVPAELGAKAGGEKDQVEGQDGAAAAAAQSKVFDPGGNRSLV